MYNETTRLVKVVMPVDTEEDIQQGETNPILASVNPTRAAESAGTPTDSGAIMLSDTAENLYIAYEVVAMVKDESTGKTHFSQLKWKRLGTVEEEDGGEAKSVADPSGDGEQIGVKGAMRDGAEETEDEPLYYQFMFESGDLFVAAAADEYPALDGDELQMLSDSSSGGGSGGSTGGGVLVVRSTVTGSAGREVHTLDKTWKEIADAGYAVVYERQTINDDVYVDFYGVIAMIGHMDAYNIGVRFPLMESGTTLYYETDAEDGYPATTPKT